jgi:polysaccharide export outer membrane protein
MYFEVNRMAKAWAIAALLPVLTACANMAPGMYLGAKDTQTVAADAQVDPVIKLITPALLQSEREARTQGPDTDIGGLLASEGSYRIASGDILSIVILDHPELTAPVLTTAVLTAPGTPTTPGSDTAAQTASTTGFVVNYDGMVQFPFIGQAKLAGLTEMEARSVLATKLAPYLRKPNITLRVQAYRSKRIYVDGEVKAPGMQIINDIPMTLIEAINRAGGFLPTGDQSQINITRAGKTYQVDLPQLMRKGFNPADIMLANGDVVQVSSREDTKVFVLGEVTTPKSVPMRNGRLSLNAALGEAGGLNPLSAAGQQVYVVRNATGKEPIVYNLDARSPVALAMAEDFELKSKDVVFVDASSLARFSRVVGLILPSAVSTVSAATSYQAVKK